MTRAAVTTKRAVTAAEARILRDRFTNNAREVQTYLRNNWKTLSDRDYNTLYTEMQTLLTHARTMNAQAIRDAVRQSKVSCAKLRTVTAKAEKAISRVTTVKKVLAIVAAVVALGAAIMRKDPAAIMKGVSSVVKEVNVKPAAKTKTPKAG